MKTSTEMYDEIRTALIVAIEVALENLDYDIAVEHTEQLEKIEEKLNV